MITLEDQLRASLGLNKAIEAATTHASTRAQISPSVLNSFQDIWNDECPWMNPEKFKTQLLGDEPMSLNADAGNAVHEAAFDHSLNIDGQPDDVFFEITNADGNTWWVQRGLIRAIRLQVPEWGQGVPEVPHLITEEQLGVPDVQISLRADYLTLKRVYELKTSKRINAEKFLKSAQKMAYLSAFGIPVTFILAQVKITHPRSRPAHVRGAIALDWIRSISTEPTPQDLKGLQQLVTSCHEYLQKDPEMIAHMRGKKPPDLL